MTSVSDVVDEQPNRSAVVADDDVGVAVVVDVAKRRAAADVGQRERRARLTGDVLEAAVAGVAEQLLALTVRKLAGRASLHRDLPVDGQDIKEAVVVEIEPGRAKSGVRKTGRSDPGARAD